VFVAYVVHAAAAAAVLDAGVESYWNSTEGAYLAASYSPHFALTLC